MTTSYNAAIPYNSALGYNGLPPIVTAAQLPTLELRVTDKSGNSSPLPEAIVDSMSFESNMANSISLSVAEGTVGYEQTDDYSVVDLYMNGAPVEDGRWLLRDKGWNEGKTAAVRQFTGKSFLWDRLEKTVIWDDKRYLYDLKTVGFILNDILASAQARGALNPSFTWDFDQGVDSVGNSWPVAISIEYLPGAKYSDIISNLVDRELIDISLLDDEIRVFVGGKRGSVRPAMLIVGEDVTDAPQQSTAQGIVSDVIVVGDEGTIVKRSNPVTSTAWGREEASVSQGGTSDIGTLSIVGDVALSNGDGPRVQRTYNMVIHQDRPFLPLRDYNVCDYIGVEHGNASVMSLRVKQIVFKRQNGQWAGALVLNDKFLENELRLARKVDGILGGATIVGGSRTSTPDDLKDTGIPNAPTGLGLTFERYIGDDGMTKVIMYANWNAVTNNTDGSSANDIEQYVFIWKYADKPDSSFKWVFTPNNFVSVDNIDLNRDIVAYVYVRDTSQNQSASSGVVTANSGADTIAPPAPSSALLLSQRRTVTISWDGLTSTGAVMPPDFKHIEIWTSHFSGFTPNDGNCYLEGVMQHRGDMVVSMWGYLIDETVYVKFVAVDNSGNKSAPSGQNSTVVQGILGFDIQQGAIDANSIGAGVIGAQHVKAGAMATSRLSLGPTMNLVQDPSFNDAEWRAERLTTKWADRPQFWFFTKQTPSVVRNGYYLQMLSAPAGENGGRMYVTDWIGTQYGETYYFGIYARNGEFAPNSDARIFMGIEVTKTDGSISSDGITVETLAEWKKFGFNIPIGDATWTKIRFFVRADNLTSGDFAMDDWEVRAGVGTTATAGPRGLLTPEGLSSWSVNDEQTFFLDFSTGDLFAKGQLVSSSAGRRIEVNPGETFLPEIRFFGDEGEGYAYINASSGVSTFPFMGLNSPDFDRGFGLEGERVLLHDLGFQIGHHRKSDGLMIGPGVEGINLGNAGYLYCYGKIAVAPSADAAFSAFYQETNVGGTGATLILARPPAPTSGDWFPFYTVWRQSNNTFTHHMVQRTASTWNLLIAGAALGVSINTRVFQFHVRSE
jgi:hypothetical protein